MENSEKYFVISDSVNWADEFNVHFLEILDENTYNRYMYLKKMIGSYKGYLGFGTNEKEWEDDFDYLQFEPIPISVSDLEVLNKCHIGGHDFIPTMWKTLDEDFLEEGCLHPGDSLSDVSFELFKQYVDEYTKEL